MWRLDLVRRRKTPRGTSALLAAANMKLNQEDRNHMWHPPHAPTAPQHPLRLYALREPWSSNQPTHPQYKTHVGGAPKTAQKVQTIFGQHYSI